MGYRSTKECVDDLQKNGHLICLEDEVDANLQVAEIHRRVFKNGGPAILFKNVKGCRFPMASNLFGTIERARFLFRDTIENVRRAIELKIDPTQGLRKPTRYLRAPITALAMRPKLVKRGAVAANQTSIDQLPHLVSWPNDAGGFITLPQVYTEDARLPGLRKSNLGMYRIQLSGNQYENNRQVGLHYQIHRSIGVHHQAAIECGKSFRVNIFVGGSPAMTLSAVMPLPEGMSELTFAGALAGHRIHMLGNPNQLPMYADADFCICGTVIPDKLLPEGPFGDHLGYYSLAHDFPVLQVDSVYYRDDAIWPFTVVGRPPQEDTIFGELIHELTGPIIPTVLPGVKAVHAVDAAGVHPLLLAIGSERYTPYNQPQAPQEILTQANAILGQGQLSLAKYLLIIDSACDPQLDINDVQTFLVRMLQRVDWTRDLHFQTCTTIDTLDYSGTGLNEGSKVVIAAAGPKRRELPTDLTGIDDLSWPAGYCKPVICMPGVLAVQGPSLVGDSEIEKPNDESFNAGWFAKQWSIEHRLNQFPLIVLVDDSDFCGHSINNFIWVVFTRSNPAKDIYGFGNGEFVEHKHWGCRGSLMIDARIKPRHAPPLIEDADTSKFVDGLAARGGPLAKYL